MRLAAGHPIFHTVEKSFPLRGKIAKKFSIAWKNGETVFHCVEKLPSALCPLSAGRGNDLLLPPPARTAHHRPPTAA